MSSVAKMNAREIEDYLYEVFPQLLQGGTVRPFVVVKSSGEGVRVRMPCTEYLVRPGGTVSGPAMMGLADSAAYLLIFARLGRVPMAVTTNFNINLLRMPGAVDLVADSKFLKLGKRLAVMDIMICRDGEDIPVAHTTCTYSLPPDSSR